MKFLALFLSMMLTLSAFAGATRVLDGAQITNGSATITLPSTTGTLCGIAESCTLTNKTLSGASNTFSNIPTSAIAGSALSGTNTGDVTIGTANGLSLAGQALSLQLASGSQPGALSASDFSTFNGKLSSALTDSYLFIGNGSNVAAGVALSGDATITNAGVLTIGSKKIQASKLDSGAATAGYVATADGSGGVSYSAPASVAPSVTGTLGSPTAITAGGGISFSGSAYENYAFITGSGGPVTVTANPQIAAASSVGQRLVLIGGANAVTLAHGNGLDLNGSWVGAANSALTLMWDGTNWHEVSRR